MVVTCFRLSISIVTGLQCYEIGNVKVGCLISVVFEESLRRVYSSCLRIKINDGILFSKYEVAERLLNIYAMFFYIIYVFWFYKTGKNSLNRKECIRYCDGASTASFDR